MWNGGDGDGQESLHDVLMAGVKALTPKKPAPRASNKPRPWRIETMKPGEQWKRWGTARFVSWQTAAQSASRDTRVVRLRDRGGHVSVFNVVTQDRQGLYP